MSDDTPDATPEDEAPATEDEEAGEDVAEDGEAAEDVEQAPGGLKGKLIKFKWAIVGLVAVLALGGGGAGLYLSGFFTVNKPHEATLALPDLPVFYEIPRITVDLSPSKGHARPFIRLVLQAELQGENAKAAFIANEVRILDLIQAHLRTVTVQELQGTEGTENLRADIVTITNRIIKPERAIAVLYKEILIR